MFRKLRVQAMVHESPLKRKIKEMKKRSRDFAQQTQTKRRQVYIHTGRLGVSVPGRITGVMGKTSGLTGAGLGANRGIGAKSSLAFSKSHNPDSDDMPVDHKPKSHTRKGHKVRGPGVTWLKQNRDIGPRQNEAGYQIQLGGPARWTTSGWQSTSQKNVGNYLARDKDQLRKIIGGGIEDVNLEGFGALGQEAQRQSQIQENERKAQTRTSRLRKRRRSRQSTFLRSGLIRG